MSAYQLLMDTNARIASGPPLSDDEKHEIADRFLAEAAMPMADGSARGSRTDTSRAMVPRYFMPACGKDARRRLITGELPNTQILSANHYELEILRLLALWNGENALVRKMIHGTLERLEQTCFGHFCSTGECVGASVAALRFMTAALPPGDARIRRLYEPLNDLYKTCTGHAAVQKNLPVRYFRLAMADIDAIKEA